MAPASLVRREVRLDGTRLIVSGEALDLGRFRRIFLLAAGKAAPGLAAGFQEILGDRLTEGLVVGNPLPGKASESLRFLPAAHPLPDARSLMAAQAALRMAREAGEKDLFIALLSGGASAQLCLPVEGVTLDEKRRVTEDLLRAGASIRETNTVRKHLSAVKGGRLARAARPAAVVTLAISDVIGNDFETIASGPTYWDSSTFQDALDVLKNRGLWEAAPESVRKAIQAGLDGMAEETLKKGDPVFDGVRSYLIGDNMTALQAAAEEARRLGFETLILTSSDQGEARAAARKYLAFADEIGCSLSAPLCLLAGGELTVTVKGKGKGGRNMEFALAALADIMEGMGGPAFHGAPGGDVEVSVRTGIPRTRGADWLILSMGTDGVDGPTDAAGAWVDEETRVKALAMGLRPADFLEENDSYTFFRKAGGLIMTGPTGTNVMDIRLILFRPAPAG